MEWSLIRLRKIGLPSARPILVMSRSVCWVDRGLVRRSASWSWLCTWWTFSMPFWAISRTKCRSIECASSESVEWDWDWVGYHPGCHKAILEAKWEIGRVPEIGTIARWFQRLYLQGLYIPLRWMILQQPAICFSSRILGWSQESKYRQMLSCDHHSCRPNQHLCKSWGSSVNFFECGYHDKWYASNSVEVSLSLSSV